MTTLRLHGDSMDDISKKWKNDPVTQKQLDYIAEMQEFSPYPLPSFTGTTKGEAAAYIDAWNKLAHESLWGIEHGYN